MNLSSIMNAHPDWYSKWISDPATRSKYGDDENAYFGDMTRNLGTPQEQTWFNQNGNDWGKIKTAENPQPIGDPTYQSNADSALNAGANKAETGPQNVNQVQGSNQNSSFNSAGNTTQNGTQSQDTATMGNSTQNTSGGMTQNTTGNTTGNTVGGSNQNTVNYGATTNDTSSNTSSSGTSSSSGGKTVQDTLGIGALLGQQAKQTAVTDQQRSGWLTDLMQNGGTGFQSQVDRAANNALSGPGMQGVGNGAKGRVAGSAVEGVAMDNLNQRLNASNQLAGPTGLTTAATASTPYLGESTFNNTSNTNNTSQTGSNNSTNLAVQNQNNANYQNTAGTSAQNTAGTNNQSSTGTTANNSSSLGISSMIGSENNSGTAKANGTQVATGTIPNNQQTSSGGCYACTEYAYRGEMSPYDIRRAAQFKLDRLNVYGQSLLGYSVYGPRLAKLIRSYDWFARVFKPFATAVLNEELRLAGDDTPPSAIDTACHFLFHYGSSVLGFGAKLLGHNKITTSRLDADRLEGQDLLFNIKQGEI